jgi:hypothetical protein
VSYPTNFLIDVVGASQNLSDYIIVEFANNTPIHIQFLSTYKALINFWLSPKLEEMQ